MPSKWQSWDSRPGQSGFRARVSTTLLSCPGVGGRGGTGSWASCFLCVWGAARGALSGVREVLAATLGSPQTPLRLVLLFFLSQNF